MDLNRRAGVALVLGCTLASCDRQVVDHEARSYFNSRLAPHLDLIASQVCHIKYQKAPTASGRRICPGPDTTSPKAPVNGDPGEPSDAKDSEVRAYIRYELEPYLDSLTYQLCKIRFRVDPKGPGGEICEGKPEGYKKPPGNGDP